MDKIYKVLKGVYENESLRKTIVPLFLGNTGLGKTVIIRQFAKDKGVNIVELITSQRNPFEISGLGMPDKETKRMSYWDFDTLLDMKDGDILFFDEILNGNPVVLNACLTLLEGRRMISGKELPNIMIVAAANHQGMMPLTPQIKERFVWYNVSFNQKMWSDYMFMKYSLIKSITSKLAGLIKSEDFTSYNFNTPRSIDKAVDTIINGVPTPYSATIEVILNTLINNKTKNEIKINDERTLFPGESITWLELKRCKEGVNVSSVIDGDEEDVVNTNEYVITDLDDNILVEVKNINVLKKLYCLSDSEVDSLMAGGAYSSPFPLHLHDRPSRPTGLTLRKK